MIEPLSLHALAGVRQSATAQVLLNLLERVEALEALEARPIPGSVELAAPTPEAAPVARPEGDWFAVAMMAQDMRSRGLAEQEQGDELLRLAHAQPPAPQPAPPAQEVGAALADLENLELAFESSFECKVRTSRIRPALLHYATLLQQQAAPAPAVVPVAVSERLPGPEDCDEYGFCWMGYGYKLPGVDEKDSYAMWMLMPSEESSGEVWRPAHAIPLPQATEAT